METILIDHIEVRSIKPQNTANKLAFIFGGIVMRMSEHVWEIHFQSFSTFFQIKLGNPLPAEECNLPLSCIAIRVHDTDAILAEIKSLDPDYKDFGWSGKDPFEQRTVGFVVDCIRFHTVERKNLLST